MTAKTITFKPFEAPVEHVALAGVKDSLTALQGSLLTDDHGAYAMVDGKTLLLNNAISIKLPDNFKSLEASTESIARVYLRDGAIVGVGVTARTKPAPRRSGCAKLRFGV